MRLSFLALVGTPYGLIPKIGLLCNLLVVSGGCWLYYRKKLFSKALIFYFVLPSVLSPAASQEVTYVGQGPGTYLLACFMPDPQTGKVHAEEGMVKQVHVA